MEPHPAYITTYHSIGGWKAVLMTWNGDFGFYEPYQTSAAGGFKNRKHAIVDAKYWAKDEEIDYKD